MVVCGVRAEFLETIARNDRLCTWYNAQFAQHKVVIQGMVDEFKVTSAELTSSVTDARQETKTLSEQNVELGGSWAKLNGDLVTAFDEQTAKISSVREEMSNWAKDHKVDILRLLQRDGSPAVASRGQSGSADGRTLSVDKKELSVWKLPDQVTKHEFCHWLDAIDTNLAAAQHIEYPEVVLDNVRRLEGEITLSN